MSAKGGQLVTSPFNRPRALSQLQRAAPQITPKQAILIVCEDKKSAKLYFEELGRRSTPGPLTMHRIGPISCSARGSRGGAACASLLHGHSSAAASTKRTACARPCCAVDGAPMKPGPAIRSPALKSWTRWACSCASVPASARRHLSLARTWQQWPFIFAVSRDYRVAPSWTQRCSLNNATEGSRSLQPHRCCWRWCRWSTLSLALRRSKSKPASVRPSRAPLAMVPAHREL